MIVLAGFVLLLIIFVFSVFYGTLTEGFGINDYHWAKDQDGNWVMQKVERDPDTYEEATLETIKFDSSEPYVKPLETDTNGVVIDGHVQVGDDQMLEISLLPDAIRNSNGNVINGYLAVGKNKMVKIPERPSSSFTEESAVFMPTPIVKDIVGKKSIPDSGIIPAGYYKLNRFQMATIPDGYYIYNQDKMAEIPDGYEASEDKQYIFKITDEIQHQIDRADKYSATDFTAYRDSSDVIAADPNTSSMYTSQPATRDPRQFLLDGKDSNFTSDNTYVNALIDQDNAILRQRGNEDRTSDYRASPSYSFYDNHTIVNTKQLKNTPGHLGGFCEQNKHSKMEIEKQCNELGTKHCASTNCCVLLGNETCVAGNEHGPSYEDHYRNPLINDLDYYYYKGKCYGNCKHS